PNQPIRSWGRGCSGSRGPGWRAVTRAGAPTAVVFGGTDAVTTALAPMRAFWPMVTPAVIETLFATIAPGSMVTGAVSNPLAHGVMGSPGVRVSGVRARWLWSWM